MSSVFNIMRNFIWSVFEVLQTIVIVVVAVFLVRNFIAQPFLVSGSSMEPTFRNGDYLMIDSLTYRFREPERGEVVVFGREDGFGSYYIKRIIGLPGERVSLISGRVHITNRDGEMALVEDYIRFGEDDYEIGLGEDEYLVLGDNRSFSFDSRNWGALERKNIVGLVRLRLWPVNEMRAFAAPAY